MTAFYPTGWSTTSDAIFETIFVEQYAMDTISFAYFH
jgi:hypothetical protein